MNKITQIFVDITRINGNNFLLGVTKFFWCSCNSLMQQVEGCIGLWYNLQLDKKIIIRTARYKEIKDLMYQPKQKFAKTLESIYGMRWLSHFEILSLSLSTFFDCSCLRETSYWTRPIPQLTYSAKISPICVLCQFKKYKLTFSSILLPNQQCRATWEITNPRYTNIMTNSTDVTFNCNIKNIYSLQIRQIKKNITFYHR